MAQRLTLIEIKGDADELVKFKREAMDPIFERKMDEHGIVFSLTARTDDGILIVNLWPDEESSERAFQDPEVQQAVQQAMSGPAAGPPARTHHEVLDYQGG